MNAKLWPNTWVISLGALVVGAVVLTAGAASAQDVTFTKDIAPILQRSLPAVPQPGRRRADVADHLRGGAAVRARHQGAHGHGPARRRDAAVVRREEHRHPALQGRPVAQRGGDRRRSRSGPTAARRAATRPTCRPPKPAVVGEDGWLLGKPDLIVKSPESLRAGRRARQVGLDRHARRPASPKTAGCRRSKCARSTTSRRRGHQDGRRPLRLPSHDVSELGARAAGRHELADSRGRPQRRPVPAGRRPAARRRTRCST